MKLRAHFHNGDMSQRPTHPPEHADYRARVLDADKAAERIVEGLRTNEPWALRLAAHLERVTGTTMPVCDCDEGTPSQRHSTTLRWAMTDIPGEPTPAQIAALVAACPQARRCRS